MHTYHTSSTSSIPGGRLDPKEVIIEVKTGFGRFLHMSKLALAHKHQQSP